MTNPVILLGTQSNGETLPVQVDATGRLVAEGLQGEQGPQGPEGPEGPQGPKGDPGDSGVVLPPDPWEGALLGWLNGGLAWVGTPPVPVPEDVFGPITSWSPDDGLVTVEGDIPGTVGNGVYVWQCNADGTHFTNGWDTSQEWSADNQNWDPAAPAVNIFDGSLDTEAYAQGNSGATVTFTRITARSSVELYCKGSGGSQPWFATIGGSDRQLVVTDSYGWRSPNGVSYPADFTGIRHAQESGGIKAVRVDGNILLVDTSQSLNMRVSNVYGNSLVGVTSNPVGFTVGKYLRVPDQRVAGWVLYGNDPTSLIDHLRQRRD